MTGVTNRVSFDEAADMVGRCRACVSFAVDGRPRVEAAIVRYEQPRFVVGLDATASPPSVGAEVVLVVDEGVQFFDLRAVHARGPAGPVRGGPGDDLTWFEVEPTKVTCWDYGRLRVDRRDQEAEQR